MCVCVYIIFKTQLYIYIYTHTHSLTRGCWKVLKQTKNGITFFCLFEGLKFRKCAKCFEFVEYYVHFVTLGGIKNFSVSLILYSYCCWSVNKSEFGNHKHFRTYIFCLWCKLNMPYLKFLRPLIIVLVEDLEFW